MDKSTLSNYGWVVIVTLVLAVMLALATPFGEYVGKGAGEVLKSYTQAGNNAVNPDNIETQSGEWDKYLKDGPVNHEQGIHEGGTYITIDGKTETVTSGTLIKPFPTKEPQVGDTYVYGDYEYKYGYEAKYTAAVQLGAKTTWNSTPTENLNGWGVRRLNTSLTEYQPVLETINGKPLKSMANLYIGAGPLNSIDIKFSNGFTIPDTVTNINYLFHNQQEMTKLPNSFKIPDSVREMEYAFNVCYQLEEIPGLQVPVGVTNIKRSFYGVKTIGAITIPNTVTNMEGTFSRCHIKHNIIIPSSVKDIDFMFNYASFDPDVIITFNCEPEHYNLTFSQTRSTVKITGSCSKLEDLARVINFVDSTPTYEDSGKVTIV
jgi:hypothetical protein